MSIIEISIDKETFNIELKDSATTEALLQRLPFSCTMNELNGNEKYVYLEESLPTKANYSRQIHAGDVMLFGDDCLVLFYKSFRTTYSYTPIGKISDAESLRSVLGRGNVKVHFSLKH